MGSTSQAIAAMVLILVETALVVWLLLHRAAGRRAQRLLEDRLRFETLLAELSAKLIHVEAGGIDAALESALRRMIDVLGMDRGNLDEYMDDAPGIRVSCARPGIVELPSILAAGQFPWTADTLRRGGRRSILPQHRAPGAGLDRSRQLRQRRDTLAPVDSPARGRANARRPVPRLGARRAPVARRSGRPAPPPERGLRQYPGAQAHGALARPASR